MSKIYKARLFSSTLALSALIALFPAQARKDGCSHEATKEGHVALQSETHEGEEVTSIEADENQPGAPKATEAKTAWYKRRPTKRVALGAGSAFLVAATAFAFRHQIAGLSLARKATAAKAAEALTGAAIGTQTPLAPIAPVVVPAATIAPSIPQDAETSAEPAAILTSATASYAKETATEALNKARALTAKLIETLMPSTIMNAGSSDATAHAFTANLDIIMGDGFLSPEFELDADVREFAKARAIDVANGAKNAGVKIAKQLMDSSPSTKDNCVICEAKEWRK